MGRMPHTPPANYGYYIRLLQGLAAMIDKDNRFLSLDKVFARDHVNKLTILLSQPVGPNDPK